MRAVCSAGFSSEIPGMQVVGLVPDRRDIRAGGLNGLDDGAGVRAVIGIAGNGAIAVVLGKEGLDIGQRLFRGALVDQADQRALRLAERFHEGLAARNDRVPVGRSAVTVAPGNRRIRQRGAGASTAEQAGHRSSAHAGGSGKQKIAAANRLALDEILDKGRHSFLPNPRLKRFPRYRRPDCQQGEPSPRARRCSAPPTAINALTSYFFSFAQVKWFSVGWQQAIAPAGFDGWQCVRV
jgi:hypothetical protein